MNYKEVSFRLNPFSEIETDILSSMLGEIGYESFIVEEDRLLAYVTTAQFDEPALKNVVETFPLDVNIQYDVKEIAQQNWNEEWEKNYFQPIFIDDLCVIDRKSVV